LKSRLGAAFTELGNWLQWRQHGVDGRQPVRPGTAFWTVAASVAQTIFDAGTLLHRKRAAEAAFDQAAAQYTQTALTAFPVLWRKSLDISATGDLQDCHIISPGRDRGVRSAQKARQARHCSADRDGAKGRALAAGRRGLAPRRPLPAVAFLSTATLE
jgi:hypothetical protein